MLLKKLKRQNKNLEIIAIYSTQSIVNRIFSFFLGHGNAHINTVATPEEERELLLNQFYLINEYVGQRLLHLNHSAFVKGELRKSNQ